MALPTAKPIPTGKQSQPTTVKKLKLRSPQGRSERVLKVRVPHTKHTHTQTPAPPDPGAQPITAGSSITQRQAAQMAANAAAVRYGPQGQQLNQNYGRVVQQGVDQQGWYQQYLDALQQYRTGAQTRADTTNQAVAHLSDSLRGLDQQTATQTGQANAADAAARGATVDPQLGKDASNASLVRQGLQASFGSMIANQGRTATERAANLADVVGPGQKLQAQAQNARAEREALANIAGLRGQKGAYTQSYLDSLTQSEAKNALATAIASGKDLTTQSRITETTRHNKAQEKINANNPSKQKTQAQLDYFNKHGYFPPTGPPKAPKAPKVPKPTSGPGSIPPSAENKIVAQVNNALAIARELRNNGWGQHDIRQTLLAGRAETKDLNKIPAFDKYIINAAFDLLPTNLGGRGGLSHANIVALQQQGVHARKRFPVIGKPKKRLGNLTAQQTETVKGVFGAQ